jgi:Acyl-CoA dehydrogenase, middle domain
MFVSIPPGHESLYTVKIIRETFYSSETVTLGGTVTKTAGWTVGDLEAFQAGLTRESLAALMRSTWTWDDRALRRDLARLLTALAALGEMESGSDVHRLVRGRTLDAATAFLAAVLGPRAIADTGRATEFSDALVRSPGLAGRPEDRVLVEALGVATVETVPESTTSPPDQSPEFGPMLAAHALAASGDRAAGAEYRSKLETGVLTATLAAAEASGSWDPALVRTRATANGLQWTLDGEKLFVPHAEAADVLFVIARSTAGPSLFAVEKAAAGVTVSPMRVIDPTRPLARVRLQQVPATLIGADGAGGRLMSRVLDLATVSLAGEQVQGARLCLELSVARGPAVAAADVIGELRLEFEVARVMWEYARRDGSGVAAAMAHIGCSEAFTRIARATVGLVDGDADGAGAEADALFRRAQSSQLLFGGPAVYHERLLERMGI